LSSIYTLQPEGYWFIGPNSLVDLSHPASSSWANVSTITGTNTIIWEFSIPTNEIYDLTLNTGTWKIFFKHKETFINLNILSKPKMYVRLLLDDNQIDQSPSQSLSQIEQSFSYTGTIDQTYDLSSYENIKFKVIASGLSLFDTIVTSMKVGGDIVTELPRINLPCKVKRVGCGVTDQFGPDYYYNSIHWLNPFSGTIKYVGLDWMASDSDSTVKVYLNGSIIGTYSVFFKEGHISGPTINLEVSKGDSLDLTFQSSVSPRLGGFIQYGIRTALWNNYEYETLSPNVSLFLPRIENGSIVETYIIGMHKYSDIPSAIMEVPFDILIDRYWVDVNKTRTGVLDTTITFQTGTFSYSTVIQDFLFPTYGRVHNTNYHRIILPETLTLYKGDKVTVTPLSPYVRFPHYYGLEGSFQTYEGAGLILGFVNTLNYSDVNSKIQIFYNESTTDIFESKVQISNSLETALDMKSKIGISSEKWGNMIVCESPGILIGTDQVTITPSNTISFRFKNVKGTDKTISDLCIYFGDTGKTVIIGISEGSVPSTIDWLATIEVDGITSIPLTSGYTLSNNSVYNICMKSENDTIKVYDLFSSTKYWSLEMDQDVDLAVLVILQHVLSIKIIEVNRTLYQIFI